MGSNKTITVIGAGLVGSLLSLHLAKKGYGVRLFERRPDKRKTRKEGTVGEGRSINLAISCRGINALKPLGIDEPVLKQAIPMLGRQMHDPQGELTYQAYGKDTSQYINSISRGWLNAYLLDEAEKTGQVEMFFEHNLRGIDFQSKKIQFATPDEKEVSFEYEKVLGTDGSASMVRQALVDELGITNHLDVLSHGYKELVMEAGPNTSYKMDKEALHIWPRGRFMMIALPNEDGSYTCTLFLANETSAQDPMSFAGLDTKEKVDSFFRENFADFCDLVPDYLEQYEQNPVGKMATLKCGPWNYKNEVLLMGDSSHAIVPFFGQGMNSGFEDVFEFSKMLDENGWEGLFEKFYEQRKTNADAIADMALENFMEMSDKTADEKFLYQKKIEKKLQNEYPDSYISRYSLVSFTNAPYRLAYNIGELQYKWLDQITEEHFPNVDVDLHSYVKKMQDDLGPMMAKVNE